jgi:predicted kinase
MKKDNLKILILIGIPGSGKSTWAKDYVKYNDNWIRVNRDDFREMLKTAQVCENKIEDMITELVNQTIENALMKRLNVIVDNTNLKVKYINDIIEKFKYSADIDYRVFDVSIDKAIERDNNREKKVGSLVINKMNKEYKILMDSFSFQPVNKIAHRPFIKPNFNSNLQDVVIFDIDGTIANMGKRGPFDWDQVYKDDVNPIVVEQIGFHKSKGRKVIIVTGRDATCRDMTEQWLELHGIEYDEIFTRPLNDYRKDTIIKKEIYQNEIVGKYNLLCVYDDRLQVLDMWYEQDIFTFNVNQGNFKF